MNICEAFGMIVICAGDAGCPQPLKGVFEFDVGKWHFKIAGENGGADIDPFTAKIECNGFPAGIITPAGGVIANGEAINEDLLISDLEKAHENKT